MTEHKTLFAALAAVQAEMPTLPKDATNPHFRSKFTPLDTIVETTTPILTSHGLAWSARPSYDDAGNPTLRYTLAHGASGQREDGEMLLLLSKTDPQGQGAAITYARRYAISAVLNIVADEDVDGENIAPASKPKPKGKAKAKPKPAADEPYKPSEAAVAGLLELAASKGLRTAQTPDADPDALFRMYLAVLNIANTGDVAACVASITDRALFEELWESIETCDEVKP